MLFEHDKKVREGGLDLSSLARYADALMSTDCKMPLSGLHSTLGEQAYSRSLRMRT
jgi:hypothetical protein